MKAFATMAVLAVCAWAPIAQGAVFGSPALPRSQVDQAFQITFIDFANPAPIAGSLSSWEVYAGATGDVKLQIWRPISGGYALVGQNPVTATTTGVVDFDIPLADQISVLPGDLLGFRYGDTQRNNRVITFEHLTGGVQYTTDWPNGAEDVPVGGVLPASAFGNDPGEPTGRTYSLSATITVPEPTSLALLLPTSAFLLRRRR